MDVTQHTRIPFPHAAILCRYYSIVVVAIIIVFIVINDVFL